MKDRIIFIIYIYNKTSNIKHRHVFNYLIAQLAIVIIQNKHNINIVQYISQDISIHFKICIFSENYYRTVAQFHAGRLHLDQCKQTLNFKTVSDRF